MKKEIIFISMHLPEPGIPEAGQKLAYNRLTGFLNEGHIVHLISFVNNREIKYLEYHKYEACASVNIIPITNIKRIKNILSSLKLPINIAARCDKKITELVKKIYNKNNKVEIHVEYEQGISAVPNALLGNTQVVVHDVISQSIGRFYQEEKNKLKRNFLYVQYKALRKWERCAFNKVGKIIVLNEKDRSIIKDITDSKASNIELDYPVVDEVFYKVNRDRFDKNSVLFWGAMNRKENVDAVTWFFNDIFPLIREKCPKVNFYIVGANPPNTILSLASENVIVTGFVDSPIEYFEKACVTVVPLRFGAGIKIKVLEALAARIPVVSTDVGAEGIVDKSNILYVENNEASFANKVIELMKKT